jgi:putative NADPH-quinone reductase
VTTRRIVIVQRHPDPAGGHLCHALADAYAEGAAEAGHEVRRIEVAGLIFPLLRTKAEFEGAGPPPAIAACQADILWAEHLVIVFPLWLGTMPALLKGFLEQTFRPGFAFHVGGRGWKRRLMGRSARLVVTMGMPAFAYRWLFGAFGVRGLERSILRFCGFAPVRATLVGMAEAGGRDRHLKDIARQRRLEREGR